MNFSQLLRTQRIAMGLSRKQLAKSAQLSVYTIINYERGLSSPNAHNLNKLAHAFGLSPAYLISASVYNLDFFKDDFGDPFES